MRDAFIKELSLLAEARPEIVLITGDLGFGVLDDFAKRFPDQFVNAGVAEQNMTAIACGMALEGRQVYTYSIANFTTLRCLEQIRNDVCYHDADVKLVAVGGGFSYGPLGMSHFATEDMAILRSLPNMRVVAPTDPWEAAALTRQIAAQKGPTYLRLDKGKAGLAPTQTLLGKARVIRDGKDLTLIAAGAILREAVSAAALLEKQGVSVRVLAIHTLKPIDAQALIAAARQTGGIVTVEEHTVLGGLGGAVAETLLEAGAPPRVFRRIGLTDRFPTVVGDQDYLRREYAMHDAAIAAAAMDVLKSVKS